MGESAEERCLALAAGQNGLIHRKQALKRGLTERQIVWRLARGLWIEVYPSVYRVTGSPRDWYQKLRGVSLWAERGFGLSHRAAAAQWELPRFAPGALEISTERHLRAPPEVIVHRAPGLRFPDLTTHRTFCVTSPARTLIDLCHREPRATIESSFDDFLRRERLTLQQLDAAMGRAGKRHGVGFLIELLWRHAGGEAPTESELEFKAEELCDTYGLPRPDKQVWVTTGEPGRARVDALWQKQRVVVEVDGHCTHFSREAQEHDAARGNALALALPGWLLLRWTWLAMRERPKALAKELKDALERPLLVPGAGWQLEPPRLPANWEDALTFAGSGR